jgi:exopolysaccharide biosynthesis protein
VVRAQDAGHIGRLGVPAGLSLVDFETSGGTKIAPGTVVISVAGTHSEPRTLLAWNGAGDVWFVTVDGRQSSSKGWSLAEAAGFLSDLGASDAVNFDGGGGTTFVVRGKIVNSASDNAKNNKPGSVRKAVSVFAAVS